ncbi:hypothetical protein Lfu02_23610 [Longispora fulva]|uniref:Uncharacterized protein n=1 Tax=Longispora fulva TaxID=619741 RepID=A0A8J7GI39_9ACTN|nr:hypothetical protein [Longispora fulva]MBG6139629.1 hypothetical protein [Longispora fulva]GIG57989.1 hypothetical protein Lfu02_23610 [Longispora fulva]
MNNDLHTQLAALAEDVAPVDLHSRVLASSRRLAWQRGTLAGGVALAVVGVVAGSAMALTPTPRSTIIPADTPGPSVSQSASPTPSTSPEPAMTGTPIDLANATLDIPAWVFDKSPQCRGQQTLADGTGPGTPQGAPRNIVLGKVVTGDVNHDHVLDTVAIIRCRTGQNPLTQIVAFDQDATGTVHTIGQVVADTTPDGDPHELAVIFDVAVTAEGAVQAEVGDFSGLRDADSAQYSQHQTRTYGWDGQKFHQTGGPTSVGKNPHFAKLVVTSTDLTFGPFTGGQRTGTLTVTVHNDGMGAAWNTSVAIWAPGAVRQSGTGWTGCTRDANQPDKFGAHCALGKLQPGETRTLTLEFTLPYSSIDTTNTDSYVFGIARHAEADGDYRGSTTSEAKFALKL